MAHSSILRRRTVRRYFYIVALVLLATAGWLWYLGSRPAIIANAQVTTAQVTTLIGDAATPVTGKWQTGAADNDPDAFHSQKYRLWAFKNFGEEKSTGHDYSFPSRIFCSWNRVDVYDSLGNLIDINDITFYGETSSTVEVIDSAAAADRMDDIARGLAEADTLVNGRSVQLYLDPSGRDSAKVRSPYKKPSCYDLNVNSGGSGQPLEDNLDSRPDFLLNNGPANSNWFTGVNPAEWSQAKDTILKQTPFLVLGNTTEGGGGFTNHSLELNLWVPADFDLSQLILNTGDLCDGTAWDTGTDSSADFTVSLEWQGGSSIEIIDEQNCASDSLGQHDLARRGIDISGVGRPIEERSLTTQFNDIVKSKLYSRYKIIAAIDVPDTTVSYTNQFRIAVANPDNSYLGIGKTDRDTSGSYEYQSALSTSNRLPDEYDRLEVFWETEIYMAADADKGCSGSESERIGFYDSDYPFGTWTRYKNVLQAWENDPNRQGPMPDDMKPKIDVYSADRNLFHAGQAIFSTAPVATLTFDGREDGRDVAHNDWEYENFTFEYDKIYKLHFQNIDQRTWIQIGLPYDQINALQKCIDKPLVKVYYGDVSVGGRFGSGKTVSTCRDDDLSFGSEPPAIYAHAEEGVDGSSAEYTVQARGVIDAFYSGFKYGPAPAPPNRLTFANSDDPWGGNFGGELRCMPNWWRQIDQLGDPLPGADLDLASHAGGNVKRFHEPASGLLSLKTGGNAADLNLKAVIYVKGDLLISEDINNLNQTLSKLNQIKSIYLIVQGDIFIAPNVTQIDAVLIAMPTDFNQMRNGRIFTCYIANVTDDPAVDLHNATTLGTGQQKNHASQCIDQLTINGALVARQIRLGRVTSSDPASSTFISGTYPVSEIINFLPEYYIGTPLLPSHSEWFYNSDSITVLPINF